MNDVRCTKDASIDVSCTSDFEVPRHLQLFQAGHWHKRGAKSDSNKIADAEETELDAEADAETQVMNPSAAELRSYRPSGWEAPAWTHEHRNINVGTSQGSLTPPADLSKEGQPASVTSLDAAAVSMLFSGRSERQTLQSPPPDLFVAVFTSRAAPMENRSAIRALWREVDGGSGRICARFAICKRAKQASYSYTIGEKVKRRVAEGIWGTGYVTSVKPLQVTVEADPNAIGYNWDEVRPLAEQPKAVDTHEEALQAEANSHGDILFLPCDEGYASGLLTKKLAAAMEAYLDASKQGSSDACMNKSLFMKTDDDTYVVGHRFRRGLAAAASLYGESIFAGVEAAEPKYHIPLRKVWSQWYEPLAVWPNSSYPRSLFGGPGYILGRSMIRRIFDEGIAYKYMLWNEDRAISVWVDALQQRGVSVNWVHIPGSNGFPWDYPVKAGPWELYPYVLHHHLNHLCIQCLVDAEIANNPDFEIDACFKLDDMPDRR
jgi:hypothetical protein